MKHNTKYPVSDALKLAIEQIFPDPSTGYLALGEQFPEDSFVFEQKDPPDQYSDYKHRVSLVKADLEAHIVFLSKQFDEYDCEEELIRIRGEAVATLMALRTLIFYLPEGVVIQCSGPPKPGGRNCRENGSRKGEKAAGEGRQGIDG